MPYVIPYQFAYANPKVYKNVIQQQKNHGMALILLAHVCTNISGRRLSPIIIRMRALREKKTE